MLERQSHSRSRGSRLLESGWLLGALAVLELATMGYMAVRCREEIAIEWRALGTLDDGSDGPAAANTTPTTLRLLQCVWLPCNFVDVLALSVLRAALFASTAAPTRVHSQFYALGCVCLTCPAIALSGCPRVTGTAPCQPPQRRATVTRLSRLVRIGTHTAYFTR
jgi:hypothetical protein